MAINTTEIWQIVVSSEDNFCHYIENLSMSITKSNLRRKELNNPIPIFKNRTGSLKPLPLKSY